MAQSKDILDLLDLLDEIGLDIGFLWGFVHDESRKGGQLSDFCHSGDVKEVKQARDLLRALVKSKQGSVRGRADELIQELSSVVKDGLLDETITRLELQEVPGIVARWKKLRTISTVPLPGEKVEAYLRQATTCYLYGLLDAAVALCRSVLQFALEEKFGTVGGMSLALSEISRDHYLEKLINFAQHAKIESARILTPGLARKAHKIRVDGNRSLHTSSRTESAALTTIEDAAEILSYIYGRASERRR